MTNSKLKDIANTIRGLSMDAIQKANSGHPGLPMGMADVATILYHEFINFNPNNPDWFDRDRFVLSGGHGSMLLYSLLHLYGYDLSIEDIKKFRQWGSKTPGHPEYQDTEGVETTTGPLGQGVANAVGMAIAESHLAGTYNKEIEVINHFTYTMLGDGDLQEGVSHEACAIAGHHKLGKLIALYDSNNITIDGDTNLSFTEDTKKRFEAYKWQVLEIDGHNYDEIRSAIKAAQEEKEKPSLIICKTIIGFGSPNKQGTSAVHGAALGEDELILTKKNLGIPLKDFYVSDEVYQETKKIAASGKEKEALWNEKLDQLKNIDGELFKEFSGVIKNELPKIEYPFFESGKKVATRKASGDILEAIAPQIPALFGGSADLSPSNNTRTKQQTTYDAENRDGTYMHYGIREFGMGAIMNGMALHGGVLPYAGTFFVFADYMRSAIRMSALMGLRVIYVFTHDSIGLGEDGPTHQPIEHLASLRAMPNVLNLRPADANETSIAWKMALENTKGPTNLILTRQGLLTLARDGEKVAFCTGAAKGAYVLTEDKDFDLIIMASGSEVEIALKAKEILNGFNRKVRIVSMMSTEIFDAQSQEYQESVFPPENSMRIAVEAAATQSWYKYVGYRGEVIGIDHFGASAPIDVLYEKFGITAENIASTARKMYVFHESCEN